MSFTPLTDNRPDDSSWPPMVWPLPPGVEARAGAVRLTPFTPADADELFEALDHDAVWAHVPGRFSDPRQLTDSITQRMDARGDVAWVVRLDEAVAGLEKDAVVGTTSFLDVVPASARLEIGWTAYTPAVWGTRVNPSAKLALLTVAFDQLGVGRVQLKTDVRNQRSQRAIAKLGARFEGVLRRYQPRVDGSMRDTVMFSITTEDWPAVSSGLQDRLSS
ncbi:GNAT family N-acetyltransferase [Kineosporia succinea]|uniref:RimJ/RimL family protein N-acetyltransferase n=1 Tax=Kineosporia succinea TaxID=84632 RepID=A0ABT9NZ41_9ACTN|nr:GNAT family protein [Kineosporia succinea]MDP9825571.1 RimJ/RimL family protein N-acetyltransferase [Kineosporia succinea]